LQNILVERLTLSVFVVEPKTVARHKTLTSVFRQNILRPSWQESGGMHTGTAIGAIQYPVNKIFSRKILCQIFSRKTLNADYMRANDAMGSTKSVDGYAYLQRQSSSTDSTEAGSAA